MPRFSVILMLAFLAALVVFVAASTLGALACVTPFHRGLDGPLALGALAFGLGAGALAAWQVWQRVQTLPALMGRNRLSPWAWLMIFCYTLFAVRSFCWLVYPDGGHLAIGSQDNLGDLSLHWQLAHLFANGAPWWPTHPEAAGQTLRYYPGIDAFQSLLLLVGADSLRVLVWMGLAGAAATLLALYGWGGSFTVAGFLFSGGLAGWQFFRAFHVADYQHELAWKSLPLSIFVTQRPFLYALPAGLLLLMHWRAKFFADPILTSAAHARRIDAHHAPTTLLAAPPAEPNPPLPTGAGLLPFWAEVLLYAGMPVFHLFAFLFLSGLLAWWFVAYFDRRSLRWHLLCLVGLALVPATWQVALMTGHFAHLDGVPRLEWAWMNHDPNPAKNHSFLGFWLLNFGLFVPMAVGLWLLCVRDLLRALDTKAPKAGQNREEDADAAFVVPAGLMFAAASVVMLAKWDWDNTKLMVWCYLAFLPFLWRRWVRPFAAPLRWPLCAVLFFSGGICLLGGMSKAHLGYALIQRSELDGVLVATDALPISGRFAASPDYNHPLVYCGRPMAMGYDGHLFSQGFDYQNLSDTLSALMLGRTDWRDCAQALEVRYLFWGPREEKKWPGSAKPWERELQPIAAGEWGKIYDLQAGSSPKSSN